MLSCDNNHTNIKTILPIVMERIKKCENECGSYTNVKFFNQQIMDFIFGNSSNACFFCKYSIDRNISSHSSCSINFNNRPSYFKHYHLHSILCGYFLLKYYVRSVFRFRIQIFRLYWPWRNRYFVDNTIILS